jgi:hypothetical protein
VRRFRAVFNVPHDPVAELIAGYRSALDRLAGLAVSRARTPRDLVGASFTRGHFVRAV